MKKNISLVVCTIILGGLILLYFNKTKAQEITDEGVIAVCNTIAFAYAAKEFSKIALPCVSDKYSYLNCKDMDPRAVFQDVFKRTIKIYETCLERFMGV